MLPKNKLIISSLLAACTVIFGATNATAQTETARIQGTVVDQAGAAVSGASVTVTQLDTNRVLKVEADGEGQFNVPSLLPGRYQIEVGQTNFKTIKQEVTLQVQQVANLTFALEAGVVSEVVTISNDVPLVESASSALGATINSEQIVQLPLNGRNVVELARLSPGVTQGVVGGFATGVGGNAETYRGGNVGGAALSVNGQRTQANNYLLDGVDNNESLVNTINIFPSAEAVREFRVQTSVATAEFGRGGGAILNAVTKSGTNEFHGSSYLFVRNNIFDARQADYDARPAPLGNGRRLPPFRRGQFGGTIGGPVFFPNFGEGGPMFRNLKDKVFFFMSYDGVRQFLPRSTDIATVPTAAFRNGDFSALNIQLRDPLTGLDICNTPGVATCNGTPYNRLDLLPGNRLNQAGLNYLRAFPLPNNGSQVQNNYRAVRNELFEQNVYDPRVDATLNDSNQMFVRVSVGRFKQEVTSRLPSLPAGFGSGSNPTRNNAVVVGLNSVITPKLVNELRVQRSTLRYGYEPPFSDQNISSNLGIVNANRGEGFGGGALIGGYNGQLEYTGDFGAYRVPQETYQIVDSLSYTTGNHTIKFGGTVLRRDVELFRPIAGKGYFRIYGNGDFDQCPGAPGSPTLAGSGTTRFEQANLLIGFMCSYLIGTQAGTINTRNWENAAFAQDDWRATRKLTLNFGLRYEYLTNPAEVNGKQSNFDLNTGRLVVPSESDAQVDTDTNNFGPRVGFAYDISGSGRSVLRGGYGLFYFLDRGGIDNQLAQNAPFAGSLSYDYRDGYRITLSGQGPLGNNDNRLATAALPLPPVVVNQAFLNNPVGANVLAIRPDNKISNVHQYNVQFQQQLTSSTAASVGFVGTRARNLALYYNLNGGVVSNGTAISCPVTGRTLGNCYPGIGSVNVRDDNGRASYDSLQVQLERRFSKGWQYLAAYTFSKNKDNGAGAFDAATGGINYVEPFATSGADFPHLFSFATVYELPFGRGRRFGTDMPRIIDFFLGGYQFNGVFRAQSGIPFDVRINNRIVNVSGDPYTDDNSIYLRRAAFTEAAAGTIGNLGRNSLRTPSFFNGNIGLTKNFALAGDARIQFRAEAFNFTNTFQSRGPNTDLNPANTNFGLINQPQPFTNRQIQLGLRLEF